MSKRHIHKMLRRTGSGEPVEASAGLATARGLAQLAFYAEQFGYVYRDTGQAGLNGRKVVVHLAPDLSPQARARAAENWSRYPDAASGGALPPLDSRAIDVLKARIQFDMTNQLTEKQRIGIAVFAFSFLCMPLAVKAGLGIGAAVWAALMALVAVGSFYSRRANARIATELEAAGFRLVTEPMGRRRYLPPPGETG
ncbi:hypothetical protein [Streptomyces sp. S.PB5]|uniref:hypothetical protein n=1 Tax=Streptomyces sp. S.PB5 TaxID=3020844 RepID=UPI0025B0E985|nr:hypothetical protein [Streptomyces sp. S.PB5]MDN3026712.1 hypothetical protein [Streptomyces sp. S.PB5]